MQITSIKMIISQKYIKDSPQVYAGITRRNYDMYSL